MSVEGSQTASANQSKYALSDNPQAHAPTVFSNTRLAAVAARLPESSVNSVCGALAGAASGIVTCPLDVIKTKLQAQGAFRPKLGTPTPTTTAPYHGMVGTAGIILRQDGLRGMYRGLGPMMIGYLPTWAVYMTVYGSSRDYYYTMVDNKWLAQVYASLTAGACSTMITNPIWVVKTRLMSQVGSQAPKNTRTPWHYLSTRDAFRKMYQHEGLGAFYSGLVPAMLGLTHVAIQFPLYEYFKLKFTGLEMGQHSPDNNDNHWLGITAATFLSKVCATTATYPHEVLRTRLQTQQRQRAMSPSTLSNTDAKLAQPRYQGIVRTCQTIIKEEGWRAFYYGMGTNLVRAVPSAITTMLTFETLKRYVQRLQHEGRETEARDRQVAS